MEENKFRFLKTYIITIIISLIVGVAIFLIYFLVNNKTLYAAINGTSIAAIVLLSIGGLMFVGNEGFFDFASYGFKQVGSSMFGKKGNEKNDFVGYKQEAKENRKNKAKLFIPILVSGAVFLIAMIVLRVAA
mgnify:CR=1 FL=1